MAYETLLLEKQGAVAIVKMNRPPVNPLNVKLYLELYDMLCELEADETVAAIVVNRSRREGVRCRARRQGRGRKECSRYTRFSVHGAQEMFREIDGHRKTHHCGGLRLGAGRRL